VNAKIGAGNAGPRIERNHAYIVGAHENPGPAGSICGGLVVDPMSNAAAGVAVSRALNGADPGIASPPLRAGAGIERDDLVKRRTEDEAVLDEQRRHVRLRARHHCRRAGLEIAGTKMPGTNEVVDIGRRDLAER